MEKLTLTQWKSVGAILRYTTRPKVIVHRVRKNVRRLALAILQLEEENAQLKRIVADLTLDKQMLQDVLKKKL